MDAMNERSHLRLDLHPAGRCMRETTALLTFHQMELAKMMCCAISLFGQGQQYIRADGKPLFHRLGAWRQRGALPGDRGHPPVYMNRLEKN